VFLALTLLKPDGFGAWFNLGVVYAKMRMIDSATEMFEKALSLNPTHELVASYLEKVRKIKAATKPE
jgi:Tfp pilus assembly protein PilF